MVSVFSKRLLASATAALLFPIAASAMQSYDYQSGKGTQQSCPLEEVEVPLCTKPTVTCTELRHVVVYKSLDGVTIHKHVKDVADVLAQRAFTDGDGWENQEPIAKLCPNMDDVGQLQSQSQCQKGLSCGETDTKATAYKYAVKANGTTTGSYEVTTYRDFEMHISGGGGWIKNVPCQSVSQQEFLKDLNPNVVNLFGRDLENAIDDAVETIRAKGCVQVENGQVSLCDAQQAKVAKLEKKSHTPRAKKP